MTYFQIHHLHREGHSISRISQQLGLNRRTVKKYLSLSEEEFEHFLSSQTERRKVLLPYQDFIRQRLERYRDTSAAQMHDWLKEHFPTFPAVSAKTVFNFVSWVRERHQLPLVSETRQHQLVEETPYGRQAQVDFGEYNLPTSLGTRTKVYFFALVLSRSRLKYVCFTDRPFTAALAIGAHQQAFAYLQGMPQELVYDQDKVFLVSENHGDLLLTQAFGDYTRYQGFALHFCRKADPQSKGKVENVVKYVKQNFLYNRTYHDLETLNQQVLGWLERTANALPHGLTRKVPQQEWLLEQPFLLPCREYGAVEPTQASYTVRKDNSILYKGNLYSLPLGTYQGKGSLVRLRAQAGQLVVLDSTTQAELCRHPLAVGKGGKVLNTDHRRDKSAAIEEMIEQLCRQLPDREKARQWLLQIRADKPRYIRDQLQLIAQAIEGIAPEQVGQALAYCLTHRITRATDFQALLRLEETKQGQQDVFYLNPLSGQVPKAALLQPQMSSLEDYQNLMRQS